MHVVGLGAGIFLRNIAFEVDTNHQQKWVPTATDCPSRPNVVAISSSKVEFASREEGNSTHPTPTANISK